MKLNKSLLVLVLISALICILFSNNQASTDGAQYYSMSKSLTKLELNIDDVGVGVNVKKSSNGHYYCKGGFGLSLFQVPVYFALDALMKSDIDHQSAMRESVPKITNIIISILALVLFALIAKRYNNSNAVTSFYVISLLLTTPFLYYSSSDFTEPMQSLLLLLLYSAIFIKRIPLVAGFAIGLLLVVKPIYILMVIPTVLYMYRKESNNLLDLSKMLSVVMGFATIYLYYNYIRYDDFMNFGDGIPFDTNIFYGLYGLIASPGKGLLLYAPLTFIAFVQIYKNIKSPNIQFIAVSFFIFLFVYAKYHFWHGDWAWGPRYIIPFIPLLFISICATLNTTKFSKLIFTISVLIGFMVNFPSAIVPPSNYLSLLNTQIRPSLQDKYQKPISGDDLLYNKLRYSAIAGNYWMLTATLREQSKSLIQNQSNMVVNNGFWKTNLEHPEHVLGYSFWWLKFSNYIGFYKWLILNLSIVIAIVLIGTYAFLIRYDRK